MVNQNKGFYVYQIAMFRNYKKYGYNSYKDLKKLTLKELKNLFNKCEVLK